MDTMFEKQCAFCGKTFTIPLSARKQKCCSRSCAGRLSALKDVDLTFDWKKEQDGKYTCRYNPEGCKCSNRKCLDCGWNPEVAKARTEKLLNQFKEVPV